MATISLEERLTAIENELAQIKQKLEDKPQGTKAGWQQIVGVFKDCPEFEEAVQLGREWRDAQNVIEAEAEAAEDARGSA